MWWGTDILNDLYMMRYGYAVENQEVGHAVDQEQTAHCYVLTWQFRLYCFLLISLCWKETAFIEIDMIVRRRQLWSNPPLFKNDPPSQQPVITYKQIVASKNVHFVYCTSHSARYTMQNAYWMIQIAHCTNILKKKKKYNSCHLSHGISDGAKDLDERLEGQRPSLLVWTSCLKVLPSCLTR